MINIQFSQGNIISMILPSNSLEDLLEKSTDMADFSGEQRVKIILLNIEGWLSKSCIMWQ